MDQLEEAADLLSEGFEDGDSVEQVVESVDFKRLDVEATRDVATDVWVARPHLVVLLSPVLISEHLLVNHLDCVVALAGHLWHHF